MVFPSTSTEIIPFVERESPRRTMAMATFEDARFFSKALPFGEIFTFVMGWNRFEFDYYASAGISSSCFRLKIRFDLACKWESIVFFLCRYRIPCSLVNDLRSDAHLPIPFLVQQGFVSARTKRSVNIHSIQANPRPLTIQSGSKETGGRAGGNCYILFQ